MLTREEFHGLIDRHGVVLYRLAFRLVGNSHEAEDIVQETLRSAWLARDRCDPSRSVRAWLVSILRRRAVDHWRRSARTPPAAGDRVYEVSDESSDPANGGYSDEMQAALGRLSAELRESLLLVVVAELTHQEAADLLGAPLGTVLSRVSRARARLRQHLTTVGRA